MDEKRFFDSVRSQKILGDTISTEELNGTKAILAATEGWPVSWRAYALATAFHETNSTMLPVVEAYWLSESWRKANLRYYPWHGRGYVQLTWLVNYQKADAKLGLNGALLRDPRLAMQLDIAARIMRFGMDEGWFAGDGPQGRNRHTLRRHLPNATATLEQFKSARRIINGVDKDLLIARIALRWQAALLA